MTEPTITLPRALVEEMRDLIVNADYSHYGIKFREMHNRERAAIAAIDAALEEQKETFADFLVRRSWEAHRAEIANSKRVDEAFLEEYDKMMGWERSRNVRKDSY